MRTSPEACVATLDLMDLDADIENEKYEEVLQLVEAWRAQ